MCCAPGMCPGPYLGGGGGGGGSERHTLFWENITFSLWLDDPSPFFQPNYRNAPPPPFSKVYLRPCVPPSRIFFENFERQSGPSARKSRGQIPLSVSSYLCLFSLLYKPLQPWLSILHFHSYWNSTISSVYEKSSDTRTCPTF